MNQLHEFLRVEDEDSIERLNENLNPLIISCECLKY